MEEKKEEDKDANFKIRKMHIYLVLTLILFFAVAFLLGVQGYFDGLKEGWSLPIGAKGTHSPNTPLLDLEKWDINGKRLSYEELETKYHELYNFTYPYILKEEIKAMVIPTGTPKIYGRELGVAFDKDANEMISILREYEDSPLNENLLKRYVSIGSKISCEYCCGARTLVMPDGTRACGCAHSYAMRGLAKYLLLNHQNEYSDDEILEELAKWKTIFFPKQSIQKVLNKYAETNEIDPSVLLDMPNMVGNC